jgi:hypothetical protein
MSPQGDADVVDNMVAAARRLAAEEYARRRQEFDELDAARRAREAHYENSVCAANAQMCRALRTEGAVQVWTCSLFFFM